MPAPHPTAPPSAVSPGAAGHHDGYLRSFKARRGRMTPGQRAALASLHERYGLDAAADGEIAPALLDPVAIFGRRAPVVLEIGFGMGETTVAMAAADPGRDLLAVDVHTPGAGALMRDAAAAGLPNIRVLIGDAVPLLRHRIAPGTLDEIRIYFPDPWPKARHHKRRLVTPEFARLAAARLRPGGTLHCATDWVPYAEQMLAVLGAEPLLENPYADGTAGGYAPRPPHRPVTRFEQQGLARGHVVRDVIMARRTP